MSNAAEVHQLGVDYPPGTPCRYLDGAGRTQQGWVTRWEWCGEAACAVLASGEKVSAHKLLFDTTALRRHVWSADETNVARRGTDARPG